MQLLSLQDIIQACLDGLKNGTLAAPYISEETPHDCQYVYPEGYRCAIGLAFDDETVKLVQEEGRNDINFQSLVSAGLVGFLGTHTDMDMVMDIQAAHDQWVGHGDDPGFRQAFLEVLESAVALAGAQGTA